MAIVEVVDMARVQDRGVATPLPVHVIMSLVRLVRFHDPSGVVVRAYDRLPPQPALSQEVARKSAPL